MAKNYHFCLSLTLILMAFLLAMSGIRRHDEALAARIAPKILRFHVLANSDSPEDQALKIQVRDVLLNKIRDGAAAISDPDSPLTRDELISYLTENREALEDAAEDFMAGLGYGYPAEVRLETCEFPEKTYGDLTFPAGTYEAVRVVIGEGRGKNFWCVLYPSLCYLDGTHAVVPDSSREELKNLLPEDDFQSLLAARRPGRGFAPALTGRNGAGTQKSAGQSSRAQKAEQESLLPRLTIRFRLLAQ